MKIGHECPGYNKPARAQIRPGDEQVTSHYLNQWWNGILMYNASLGLDELTETLMVQSDDACTYLVQYR